MFSRRRGIHLALVVLVAATMLVGAQIALAVFNKTAAGGPLTVATPTLSPPTGVSATQTNCHIGKSPEIEVKWTATTSSYASSYIAERATAGAGPYTELGSVAINKTSYTDKSNSLGYLTTYYYRVTAVYDSWSATSTSASVKTLSNLCLTQ